ncbi:MAG: hypothetical protein ACTHOK_16270 [Nocardioidaceae bacterium]
MGVNFFPAPLAAGTYVHWGVISISVTNLAIIGAMVVVFVLALVVPFPHARERSIPAQRRPDERPRS